MSINLVNLTKHTINETTTGASIPTSGIIARIKQSTYETANINGMPVFTTECTGIIGLPHPKQDTVYIVSALALQYVPNDRTDVVATGNICRDQRGHIVGCSGFRTK